jgi:preprotein translocase subunit SecG
MFTFLLILQCSISVLIIFAVLLQKTGKESLGGLKTDLMGTPETSSRFLTRATAILVTLFFINSIVLANISCRAKTPKQAAINIYTQYAARIHTDKMV